MKNSYKTFIRNFISLLLCILVTWQAWEVSRESRNGAVSSTSKIASDVGIDVLKKGGNAFDAIVATGFALAVTSPANGNIGGGGFLVAHTASGESISLDFREKAPKLSYESMFLNDNGEYDRTIALESHKSSGVPGTVNGLLKILNDYGSGNLSLQEILAPAIDYAENGFVLNRTTARSFNYYREQFNNDEGTKRIFVKDQEWKQGDIIIQKDLAETLKRISALGNAGFYDGETANLIVKEMNDNGGLISKQDLLDYNSVYREPVTGTYKGYKIISMGPPSSGGALIVQMLNMLENFDVESMKRNSTEFVHLLTEIQRLAYADRATHLGDPDFWDNPIAMLTSKEYAKERLDLISMEKATPSLEIAHGTWNNKESVETTHYSVMDKAGNVAGITTTINLSYGNKKVVDGAGFFLNNEMDDFSSKPGVGNAFGLIGLGIPPANAIQPFKRPLSSMSPTIVVNNNNEGILTVGAAGGSRIITAVLQTIISVLDHDLTVDKAIDTPRTHSQWLPDQIFYEEDSFNQKTIKELQELNHTLKLVEYRIARAHGIQFKNGKFITGSDKRGSLDGSQASTY
ncbi:MAG: gamma-glutamyltransferase [Candidatus Neomarinimicrobiota bacterium]|nr:MAG: gamma-glutamyltransferase [Candidatus Neomarinimicrobiota bacterium]